MTDKPTSRSRKKETLSDDSDVREDAKPAAAEEEKPDPVCPLCSSKLRKVRDSRNFKVRTTCTSERCNFETSAADPGVYASMEAAGRTPSGDGEDLRQFDSDPLG